MTEWYQQLTNQLFDSNSFIIKYEKKSQRYLYSFSNLSQLHVQLAMFFRNGCSNKILFCVINQQTIRNKIQILFQLNRHSEINNKRTNHVQLTLYIFPSLLRNDCDAPILENFYKLVTIYQHNFYSNYIASKTQKPYVLNYFVEMRVIE